jgi:glucose/arabinose dehydrogenase
MRRCLTSFIVVALWAGTTACFRVLAGGEGGKESKLVRRPPDPADVAVPDGYEVEVVASGFTFPIGVAFDAAGRPVVLEAGYSYGEVFTTPKLVRLEGDGTRHVIAQGGEGGPWTGITFHHGFFYVVDGGESNPGRVLRVSEDGTIEELVTGLPTLGDHHGNGPVVAPDGTLYFATGTATNSAVVGIDNFHFGWLKRFPDFHDVPCADVTLTGFSERTENPLTAQEDQVETGPYLPFGTPAREGQVISGKVPCSGGVFRTSTKGGPVELVAWGFRNPFGLALDEAGQVWVTENGYDIRGSRPVFGASDNLWKVEQGRWYGWPDHSAGEPIHSHRYAPPGKATPKKVLMTAPGEPPSPVALLGVHSSSNGFDFSRSETFGYRGEAFVAQFGDLTPATGKLFGAVGFRVVRVQPDGGIVHTFAANRKGGGPASALRTAGFERPTAARFSPDGSSLYVVDFGVLDVQQGSPVPLMESGVLWRIRRKAEH